MPLLSKTYARIDTIGKRLAFVYYIQHHRREGKMDQNLGYVCIQWIRDDEMDHIVE